MAAMKMRKILSSGPRFGGFCVGASNKAGEAAHENVSRCAAHPASINRGPVLGHRVPDADTRRTGAELSFSSFEDKQCFRQEIGDCQSVAVFDPTKRQSHITNLPLFSTVP